MTKRLQQRIKELEARIRDLEAFSGVMLPVFEQQYKKGGWDFSKK
jgi:hypothetical protein